MIKISFMLQYRRIFPTPRMRKICDASVVAIVLWAIAQITLLALTCSPLTQVAPWMAPYCLPQRPIWLFSASMNIVTDFIILCVPIPIIIRLHMSMKQKVILLFTFCIGFL
jgi:hypothetical protein